MSYYGHGQQSSDDWLAAALCSDQGSDMMSLVHATLYYEPVQLNLWEFWDVLHGCTRCLMGTVTQEDLKPLVHLSLMCINLPHGPEESDYTSKQIVDFMSGRFAHSSPRLSPLLFSTCTLSCSKSWNMRLSQFEVKEKVWRWQFGIA